MNMHIDNVETKLITREILLGFWKVHILHHAKEGPVVGMWMLQELRRHGYDLSPGTLYPLLQRMEQNGWLRSESNPGGGPKSRKNYYLTKKGKRVLNFVKDRLRELWEEVGDETAKREN